MQTERISYNCLFFIYYDTIVKNHTFLKTQFVFTEYTAAVKSLQSCPTLCDLIDGSPPGSPIPGILQARTLEWVTTSFSNAWKWKVKVKALLTEYKIFLKLQCMCYDEFRPPEGSAVQTQRAQSASKNQMLSNFILF